MTSRLAGKVAVVTGAGSGIGLASARRFAAEGAHVVCVDIDEFSGKSAAEAVGGLFVRADVTDETGVVAMYAAAVDTYGGLDIAFNNAGIAGFQVAESAAPRERAMAASVGGTPEAKRSKKNMNAGPVRATQPHGHAPARSMAISG